MNAKDINETSKFLSYILRHEPQSINLKLDSEGWAAINDLISGAAKKGRNLNIVLIQTVVNSSEKSASVFRKMDNASELYKATHQLV